MKRIIATVSFALLATPVFAQSSLGRTDAIGPDFVFGFNSTAAESIQVASSGATRSDADSVSDSGAEQVSSHVERQPGYFDPSN